MQIIPAIDIIEGKCVRLTHGDYAQQTVYNEDPLEVALAFEDAGLSRLHLVDLDGARTGAVKNWKVLERIAGKTKLVIDFGGGIKSDKDVAIVFDSGASLAAVGSVAVKDAAGFAGWILRFGGDRFFLGADVRDEKISISGWQQQTDISVYDLIEEYLAKGITNIFCTDISKDGALAGPAFDLYAKIIEHFSQVSLVASGGVSNMDDVYRLKEKQLSGVIIGKAIYENRIRLSDLKIFMDGK